MNTFSRKDFLKLSSLGLVSTLLPFQEIKALSFILEDRKQMPGDFKTAVALAVGGKEAFYRKQYDRAEEIYLRCIELAPASIRFYDNLDNVYGAKGDFVKSILLYRNGLGKNPGKIAFYDRTARALMRLELGYRSTANDYKLSISSTSLLNDALALYDQAITIDPKSYLYVGKSKVEHKIAIDAVNKDFRKDKEYKVWKNAQGQSSFDKYNNLPTYYLLSILSRMDERRRNNLYFQYQVQLRKKHIDKEKKIIFKILTNRYLKDGEVSKAIDTVKQLFEVDKSDPNSIKLLQRLFYKNEMFYDYIEFKSEFSNHKPGVYSKLGVIHAIQKAFEHGVATQSDLKRAAAIALEIITNWRLSETAVIDVVNKYCKILLLQGDSEKALSVSQRMIETITVSTPMHMHKMIYTYCEALLARSDLRTCYKVLFMAIYGERLDQDGILDIVELLVRNTKGENNTSKLSLYYLLHETYRHLGQPEDADKVLTQIEEINPGDIFVLKRR